MTIPQSVREVCLPFDILITEELLTFVLNYRSATSRFTDERF
jgi:hypothetical protein